MEMRNAHTISTLRDLIAVNHNAERGFRTCADRAHEADTQIVLGTCASTCVSNARELHALVRQLGTDLASEGERSTTGRRGWNDLRLTATDDTSLLEECERCEAYTLEMYRNALDDHLPVFVRRIVLRQFIRIMRNQERLRPRQGGDGTRRARRANTGS